MTTELEGKQERGQGKEKVVGVNLQLFLKGGLEVGMGRLLDNDACIQSTYIVSSVREGLTPFAACA